MDEASKLPLHDQHRPSWDNGALTAPGFVKIKNDRVERWQAGHSPAQEGYGFTDPVIGKERHIQGQLYGGNECGAAQRQRSAPRPDRGLSQKGRIQGY